MAGIEVKADIGEARAAALQAAFAERMLANVDTAADCDQPCPKRMVTLQLSLVHYDFRLCGQTVALQMVLDTKLGPAVGHDACAFGIKIWFSYQLALCADPR